jgi:hypothetical protein
VRVAGQQAPRIRQAHIAEHVDDALAAHGRAQRSVRLDDLVGLVADGHQGLSATIGSKIVAMRLPRTWDTVCEAPTGPTSAE